MKENIINLKVSDFKLMDKENNIYAPNSYPTKDKIKFYPNIYILIKIHLKNGSRLTEEI